MMQAERVWNRLWALLYTQASQFQVYVYRSAPNGQSIGGFIWKGPPCPGLPEVLRDEFQGGDFGCSSARGGEWSSPATFRSCGHEIAMSPSCSSHHQTGQTVSELVATRRPGSATSGCPSPEGQCLLFGYRDLRYAPLKVDHQLGKL